MELPGSKVYAVRRVRTIVDGDIDVKIKKTALKYEGCFGLCLVNFLVYFTDHEMVSPARIGTTTSLPKGMDSATDHSCLVRVTVSTLRATP